MARSTYDKFYLENIFSTIRRAEPIIAPKLSIKRKRGAFYVPHKLLCVLCLSLSLSLELKLQLELELELKVASFMACALSLDAHSIRFDLNRLVVHSYRFYSYSLDAFACVPCKKVVALESRSGCISCPYKSTLFADLRQMGVCHTIYLHCKFNLFPAAATTIAASRDSSEWVYRTASYPV